jgi:hypothetical protein
MLRAFVSRCEIGDTRVLYRNEAEYGYQASEMARETFISDIGERPEVITTALAHHFYYFKDEQPIKELL